MSSMQDEITTVQVSKTIHARLKKRADSLGQKLRFVTEGAINLGLKQKPAKESK